MCWVTTWPITQSTKHFKIIVIFIKLQLNTWLSMCLKFTSMVIRNLVGGQLIWALTHGTSEDRKFILAREETLLVLDDWVVFFSRFECRVQVPISSKFSFSYLILYLTQWTSAKEKNDLDKMQSFRSFKNVRICRHFGPPFAPVFPCFWRNCDVD